MAFEGARTRARNRRARVPVYGPARDDRAKRRVRKTQPIPFAQELGRYAQILASSPLPAYAAISPYELDARPESDGSEATFAAAFAGFPQIALAAGDGAEQGCGEAVGCQTAYYAFASEGSGGAVRVIVLDDSSDVDAAQLRWLEGQLAGAKSSATPAIVLGNADLGAQIKAGDTAAAVVAQVLVGDGASAYFYDSPEENVQKPLEAGGGSIPSFGSGTLGYVNVNNERFGDFHGASGFLLGQVDVAARNPASNVAPVSVRLIPDIGELALEATDGILLRRSNTALFAGARAPSARGRARRERRARKPRSTPTSRFPRSASGANARPASSPSTRSPPRTPKSAASSRKTSPRPTPTRRRCRGPTASRSPTNPARRTRSPAKSRACSAPTTRARRS